MGSGRGARLGPPSLHRSWGGGLKPALRVLAVLLAGSAAAQAAPPASPPWSCQLAAAWDARGCVALPVLHLGTGRSTLTFLACEVTQ